MKADSGDVLVTIRGSLGLTTSPPTAEITAKLGSLGEYLNLLTRVELGMKDSVVAGIMHPQPRAMVLHI